ncbi:MAG: hypothetical protein U0746_22035 [Gemmataceae bacterium]
MTTNTDKPCTAPISPFSATVRPAGTHCLHSASGILQKPARRAAGGGTFPDECCLDIAPDGRAVVVGRQGGPRSPTALFDLGTGRRVELPAATDRDTVAYDFSADGERLVVSAYRNDSVVTHVWDRRGGRIDYSLPGEAFRCQSAAGLLLTNEAPDGNGDAPFIVRDASRRERFRFRWPAEHTHPAFSGDGRYLQAVSPGKAAVIDAVTGRCIPLLSPGGLLVVGDTAAGLKVDDARAPTLTHWDLRTGARRGPWELPAPAAGPCSLRGALPESAEFCLQVSVPAPQELPGSWLAALPLVGGAFGGRTAFVFLDARTGRETRRAVLPAGELPNGSVYPGGRTALIAAGGDEATWYLWDLTPPRPLRRLVPLGLISGLPLAWLARRRAQRLRKT